MMTPTKAACSAMTLLGLMTGSALAEEAAVIRITDKQASPPAAAAPASMPAPADGAMAAGAPGGAPLDAADCPPGGGAGGGLGSCLAGHHCYCPTAGYRPIDFAPINRDAVVYWHYWPAKWYGQPGWQLKPTYPMVYMPTDTTQSGFYYQRVPQWQPNPGMYPAAAPNPTLWHRRVVYGAGGVGGGDGSGAPHDGGMGGMKAGATGSINASGETAPVMPAPNVSPQAPAVQPPSQPAAMPFMPPLAPPSASLPDVPPAPSASWQPYQRQTN